MSKDIVCCGDKSAFNYVVTSVKATECKVILEVCSNCDLCDGQPFNFRLCECIRECGCKEVVIKVGHHKEFPLYDKIGDKVYAHQVKTRKIYNGVYGSDCPHVLCFNIRCGF